jgi:peptidoglycan/LPS O-acetylase OafA/YrhL
VVLVVIYHYWPGIVRGGYVGVDVFFVISGFLISAHLIDRSEALGLRAITSFWARRARRLLPASLLVLVVTAVAVVLVVPRSLWQQFMSEIVASAVYVQNWLLASNSVDYLAANNTASPVQHFWSLSVEEQFYLAWPIVVLGTIYFAARLVGRSTRVPLAVVLAAVIAVSFGYGIYLTATEPSVAYFATTTRAWEFAAGGLLAVYARSAPTAGETLRSVVSWVGILVILASAIGFTGATPFPGVAAAAPVAGAIAVIWAGSPVTRFSPSKLLAIRPVQYLGDISYSVYLWHFPFLIIGGYALAGSFGLVAKVCLLVGSVVLAALTKRFVEDPVRRARLLAGARPRRTFLAMAASVVVVAVVAGAAWGSVQLEVGASAAQAKSLAANSPSCFGAAAMLKSAPQCPTGTPIAKVVPQPAVAANDLPAIYEAQCRSQTEDPTVRPCVFGHKGASFRVALIGDSHAASWFPALDALAVKQGWELTTYFKGGCPFSEAKRIAVGGTAAETASCAEWNKRLVAVLGQEKPFNLVVTTAYGDASTFVGADGEKAAAVDGFRAAWAPLIARGSKVAVIKDVPHAGVAGAQCLVDHPSAPTGCVITAASSADKVDYLPAAAHGFAGADLLSFNSYFCTASTCPTVIGGVFVYRDQDHFTATFSRSLAPFVLAALKSTGLLKGQH